MLPALARHAIEAYTEPGELVIDPMCGIGTSLVEAAHLGRRAIGVELEPRWTALAAANICDACEQGATGQALAMRGDARRLGRGLLDELAGEAALILTSPPYGPSTHGQVRIRSERLEKSDDRYSEDGENLGQLPAGSTTSAIAPRFRIALLEILVGCRRLLSSTGVLMMTTRPYRHRNALVDLPGAVVDLAAEVGLILTARHAALLAGLRGDQLVPRVSFFQLQRQRTGAVPRMQLIAHEDVLVFCKTPTRASSARSPRRGRRRTGPRPSTHRGPQD
jgi:modification methylase